MHIEHVPLAFDQRELYDELKKKFSEEVAEKTEVAKRGGQVMLMELRKTANHHLLVRKKYDEKKLSQMARLMLTVQTCGTFCHFLNMICRMIKRWELTEKSIYK